MSGIECRACGMLVEPVGSYHPYAACLMFKACKNGNTVQANLDAVVEYGRSRALPSEPVGKPIDKDAVEWVVNDIAELGVKIGNQFFFLYKGYSLVYEDSKHGDGSPMHWRPVFKREFGECCHPVNYEDLRKCGHQHLIGTVNLTDSDEWKPLPGFPETKSGSES